MFNLRKMAWVVMAVCVATWLVGSVVYAAGSNEVKIGVVDVQRVYKDAPRVKQYKEGLDAFQQQLANKLEIRAQNMMLDENEIKELIDLKTKDKPTDQDKARIDQLINQEKAKDEELKKLQETKDLTDQQKARLKELQDLQQKSKDAGNAVSKDYQDLLQNKAQELQVKVDADLQAAISKAAEAKGMTMIIDKAAVLLGGTEITDDVIARLDRKAQ